MSRTNKFAIGRLLLCTQHILHDACKERRRYPHNLPLNMPYRFRLRVMLNSNFLFGVIYIGFYCSSIKRALCDVEIEHTNFLK
jgi:hypothetical protein